MPAGNTYAAQFQIEDLTDGRQLITIGGTDHYVLLPEGISADSTEGAEAAEEEGLVPDDAVFLQLPLDHIYLAASSAMDFFDALGRLDSVCMTSTKPEDWSLPAVRDALEAGSMQYVGKYSAPDFEQVVTGEADAAIESTMIYHTPETMEQLVKLGIPVLVERSSYETDPLGRLEWIRLYGVLTGKEEEADAFFDEQVRRLAGMEQTDLAKSAAFFYLSANGYAVVRRPGDYISEMIRMAGGTYLPADLPDQEEGFHSTMNMEMESFYETVREADVIFYNSTIDGEIYAMEELLQKNPLLGDFKAVKENQVWCTGKNMFQQVTGIVDMVLEMNRILAGTAEEDKLQYFHRVAP